RLVDPVVSASVSTAIAMGGSVNAATVISRLEPMPPNTAPGSTPTRGRKNGPRLNKAASTKSTPNRPAGCAADTTRASGDAANVAPTIGNGATGKSHEALAGITIPFR